MRFQGDIVHNLTNAIQAKDENLAREMLNDELATIIEHNPNELANALRNSKVSVGDSPSKEELVNLTSYNIVNNPIFQKNVAVMFSMKGSNQTPTDSDYASASGDMSSGGGDGGGSGGTVGAVSAAIGEIFKFGTSFNTLKSEEEKTKASLYAKVFGEGKKTNWMPVILIGGVLLIGGIIAYVSLKKD